MEDSRFDYDVFISFAHDDNEPVYGKEEGWVSMLHRFLERRLNQLLYGRSKIWRDPVLQGNEDFGEVIGNGLRRTKVLVSVLSPTYVTSDWCLREIREFIQAAEQNGGLRIDNQSRIFKVIKTRIPLEDHPTAIQDSLGYNFFRIDPDTQRPREFNMGFSLEVEPEYRLKLDDLAYDIRKMLEAMKEQRTDISSPVPSSGISVYLAETTSDLSAERDQIRRELEAHGHIVLPDQPLPFFASASELESIIRESLQRSTLSLHLMGERYGFIPEAIDRSLVELQNTLAAEHKQHNPQFSHLLWLPNNLHASDERQEAFISSLRNDPGRQKGDDLLETSLAELETIIRDKIRDKLDPSPSDPEPVPVPDSSGPTRVYLIHAVIAQ